MATPRELVAAITLASVSYVDRSLLASFVHHMVADTLLPEAFGVEGAWAGLVVIEGFAISIALNAI